MIGKLLVTLLAATTAASASAAGAQTTTYPCAPSFDAPRPPKPTSVPAAPTNLRITSGGQDRGLEPEDGVTPSGPSVEDYHAAPPAVGTHLYFEMLASRADCLMAYSLRDDAQLAHFSESSGTRYVVFGPAADSDPRRQDAAKIVIPADKVNLMNQVRLPIPSPGSESLLVTWDAWWGSEFAFANTQIITGKTFQLASGGRIWTEVRSDYKGGAARVPGAIARVDVRSYGAAGIDLGPGVTENLPLSPQVGEFSVKPETWTRYWAFFKPQGEWHAFSLWVADENNDAVLLVDGLLIKPNRFKTAEPATGWEAFWLEYNTSSSTVPAGRGPLSAYARNVVMLRGLTSPATVLARPLK